jgi:hypothetical protein
VQACPYGCRFINPKTNTAEKCSLCYHRITKGLTTACCEVCPTGARQLADLKNPKDPCPVGNSSALEALSSETLLQRPRPPATWRGFPPLETPSGVVPILGKAVLGIAGAYLLRAIAESSSVPKLPVLFLAIAYACFWMVWAVRVNAASRFASITYGITSALILSPLLWESTVRFQVLSPALAAAVTVAFVVLTIALAWRRDLQLIPWIATLASVITAHSRQILRN